MQNISIDKLQHHPLNPRQNIDDLDELIESVKANGILQNLTVIANEGNDGFYVIIGNRRLDAARAAGLTELPCEVVAETDEAIIGMMLQENMLRKNFTSVEESQGFQHMLDLGYSVETVSQATGFSGSTIRRRAKIAKLDTSDARAALEKGATLFDLETLADIKDEKDRDEVLKKFGTKDYRNLLSRAVEKEAKNQFFEQAIAYCEGLGAIKADKADYNAIVRIGEDTFPCEGVFVFSYYGKKMPDDNFKLPRDTQAYYIIDSYSVNLYQQLSDQQLSDKAAQKQMKEHKNELCNAKVNEMHALESRFTEMRDQFIRSYSVGAKEKALVREFLFNELLDEATKIGYATGNEMKNIQKFCGGDDVDLINCYHDKPEYYSLLVAYKVACRDTSCCKEHWDEIMKNSVPEFAQNDRLVRLYGWLARFGYEMSDEEKQFITGVHPVFDLGWIEPFKEAKDAA